MNIYQITATSEKEFPDDEAEKEREQLIDDERQSQLSAGGLQRPVGARVPRQLVLATGTSVSMQRLDLVGLVEDELLQSGDLLLTTRRERCVNDRTTSGLTLSLLLSSASLSARSSGCQL